MSDEKFILQKGLRSLSDKDARVGNKSKTQQFYGYKAEYTMTADERIITAIDIHTGEYVDGKEFSTLLEKTVITGTKARKLQVAFSTSILSVFANSNECSFEFARYSLQWL